MLKKVFMSFVALVAIAAAATGPARAQSNEQLFYTLDGTQTGGGSAYYDASTITQDGVTWSVTGNTMINPWRIGGKNLNGVGREVYSTGTLDETVTKVTLDFGQKSSNLTVNSVTMIVASDNGFNNVIEEKSVTFAASSTVDVTPGTGIEWTNAYYKFVFNVSVSVSSNKYFELTSIKFYYDSAPAPVEVPANSDGAATPSYWATYYNGTTSFTADANTTVYQAAANGTKTGVTLTEVASREIPAGQGVVLKKSSASSITLTPAASTTADFSGNALQGTDAATAAPANAYCLSNETTGSARGVGFYTYSGSIPAHRAYLVVAASAREFLGFDGNDNATGIALPEAEVTVGDNPVYDLSGRRVAGQPQKGIYVKNGKKIVIK